jgi:endonuclease/exonuclease/phosphatase family metal-dependent hydrolase
MLTYNIHHGCDANEKLKLQGIARVIKTSQADIVGLEEVDSVCKRSAHTDQAKFLARLTGMHYAYVRHFAFEDGSYGLALLSRFPIKCIANRRIPVLTKENGDTRALLWAKLQLSPDRELIVMVAHLDYRSDISRMHQAELIVNMLKDQDSPVILMGDLNAQPDSKTISILKKGFIITGSAYNLTFPSDKPVKKIDYILADKNHNIKTISESVYQVLYSDHRPLSAAIKLSLQQQLIKDPDG